MADKRAAELAELMTEARAETLRLFDLAREEELHESPGFGFRPVIWHLAHIGVFEGYWILQKLKGESAPDERYESIFDPIHTPREASRNLPSRAEMEDYLKRVRERVLGHLAKTRLEHSDPLLRDGYVFELVLEHEYQHQETLCYLLHLLAPARKTRPAAKGALKACTPPAAAPDDLPPGGMIEVPAGAFVMGADGASFAYDNELPAHSVYLPAYKIDRLPVTNEDYARFITEGGYGRREWWSAEGWDWREREDWTFPLYWTQQNGAWSVKTMFDEGVMNPRHPVNGVSWYEAEAYARFAGKRLPTEAEWEKAAAGDAADGPKRRYAWGAAAPSGTLCNFNNHFWGTTPVGSFPAGASPYGCLDMNGNVWEWTSDPFDGYPGFRAFPYPEYSEIWFDGDHRVLKGGSWATRAPVLRISFRNFFRRHFRIAFAGIRCAADV